MCHVLIVAVGGCHLGYTGKRNTWKLSFFNFLEYTSYIKPFSSKYWKEYIKLHSNTYIFAKKKGKFH